MGMSHKISEAARTTGFSVSALRFYEKQSIVVPDRAESGYRSYSDRDIDDLRFVRRGKQLGLHLDEIKELLALRQDEECAPLHARIKQLVGNRISQAQSQIGELVEFTSQLNEMMAGLSTHPADGACDDTCGCQADPGRSASTAGDSRLIPLAGSHDGPIACSLQSHMVAGRLDDWDRVVSEATARSRIPDGIRLHFTDDLDIGALAELAAAEQQCCSFFEFEIGVAADGVTLSVTGPDDARDVIASVFGGVIERFAEEGAST